MAKYWWGSYPDIHTKNTLQEKSVAYSFKEVESALP